MSTRLINRRERLVVIEQMLFRSSAGLRAVEIAEACGVDRRTIYRDLTLLSHVGVPVEQKAGRFCIDRDNYTAGVRLNFDEAWALFMGARMLLFQYQNPHLLSALGKLKMALPVPLATHIEMLTELASQSPQTALSLTLLETITRAWAERQKLKLWFSNETDKARIREFSTYFVEVSQTGMIYLIGFDSTTQRVRSFKLQHIQRARLLRNHYQIPSQFDARRFLATHHRWDGDGEDKSQVILCFSGDAVVRVQERYWHHSQRLEFTEDQRLHFSVQVGDWREMVNWIRSWGANVEVLEPSSLREEIAAESRRLAAVYAEAR